MEVSRIRALRGPNLWSKNTAIEAIVSCADAECSIDNLPDFEARLRARLPQTGLLRPEGHQGAVSIAHVLQIVALTLQAYAGCPVTFGRTSSTIEPGVFQVVVEYSEEEVGRLAMDLAQQLVQAALDDAPFDLADALKRLRELDEDVRLGPSTGSIVNAATARNIPYRRLTQGSMVQFGWGSKQRRIQAAETDLTSAISESIAQDKDLTKMLLDAAGVPVPLGRSVTTAEDAWAAAQELGGPVVVKPRDGSQGRGVAVNIETRERVIQAFEVAEEISSEVIVERYIPGHDFRLLVVGGALVAASRRDPPQVTGDGVHTIRQLVDQVNADPLRGDGHATSLTKIRFDDIALATLKKQGFDADSVPAPGTLIFLRNNANLSTGGSATDVTDEVHPEMAARAVSAARMIGLDICGVDVVAESVHYPLEDQNGGVVEVNAAPGLRMHLNPSFGKGRAVGEAIIANMYADGDDGRIPVVAVAGTNGKTTTVRLTAHILGTAGNRVGMTNSDGVYVDNLRIDTGDCSGPRSARSVLMHPDVDAAVFETARGGILREGLAFDRCNVAIVTNIGMGDHLGLGYISTVEDLAVVKRVIVQHVHPSGTAVLNAADPIVAEMASSCPGSITYFAEDRNHPVMATHRAQGLRVVYRDGDAIVAAQGGEETRFPLAEIPLTRNGTIVFQVENAMASIAAAWALGLDWSIVRRGLATFVNDAQTAPGRFNVFDYRGATVIADYGHNPDAILALVRAVDAMPAKRRSVVISGAGDRRDEDIRMQTEILGEAFDDVLLYQDQCQRGRADGEVLALLQQGLVNASRTRHIEEIHGEFLAIDTALARLNAGDLCLILVDQVEEALAHIAQRIREA
ncbi:MULTISPECIES: cyanophycin synthetase [Achromobacter]|jgi:cyanophycin synthetase|uniref:Cyanophycin synthetase n=1 Tax=Alcaligenes xylosoxydans xylosoxydans TaxID=85698 RepID=A0A0D6GNU8_ALCXX|nr:MULTISPECIES: cyanophycin synthetase [Achromobacter]AHC46049.1 Cyanophycin synthase [Achromobacter xylosoxidans NBRC 15126 = ATCC 27061]AXA76317.1 cyanophycin synthetase [Achromobacter xylosoxidans]EFV82394.1 cyanphycin synthetase [Achromobacter xylosoxidans C54]KAA5921015.1 cyanophycin synthetase [Achromobacter xylosoxidans]KMJ90240.1 cyanophycin synthetase [Achromobacter xylosoxidans]